MLAWDVQLTVEGHMNTFRIDAVLAASVAVFCIGCEPPERSFLHAAPPTPAAFPTAPHIADDRRHRDAVGVEDFGVIPPKPPACLAPGFYTCEDACPFAHGDLCLELAETCGVTCGKGDGPQDWDIDDPCAWTGLRLVVTPMLTGPDCHRVNWIPDMCNEQFQAYCCTTDGSALPDSE